MNPVAFSIFGIDVRWYGILIAFAIFLGIFISLKVAKKEGLDEDKLLDLFLLVIPCSIIGARAYYVIFNWSYYQGDILKMINTRQGGMAIHGGLIGGILAGIIYCKIKKLDFLKIADIVAPTIALGQSIGRWGNFINQEAHGGPTDLPWGIMVDGIKVHPTFLYESIWNLALFVFLFKFRKNRKYEGNTLVFYGIIYSIGRFFIEGLRTDSLMIGSLRMAQVISLAIIGACVLIHLYFMKRRSLQ